MDPAEEPILVDGPDGARLLDAIADAFELDAALTAAAADTG